MAGPRFSAFEGFFRAAAIVSSRNSLPETKTWCGASLRPEEPWTVHDAMWRHRGDIVVVNSGGETAYGLTCGHDWERRQEPDLHFPRAPDT